MISSIRYENFEMSDIGASVNILFFLTVLILQCKWKMGDVLLRMTLMHLKCKIDHFEIMYKTLKRLFM